MSDKNLNYKRGQLVFVSSGEYSDYQVLTCGQVLKDFNLLDVADAHQDEFKYENPYSNVDSFMKSPNKHCYTLGMFVPLLFKHGYLKELGYREMHLGSHYGYSKSLEEFKDELK